MRVTRRRFLKSALFGGPFCFGGSAVEAVAIEPEWLKVERVHVGDGGRRIAQFSDLHYRGDSAYLTRVIETINGEKPDLVCFTGDVVEEAKFFAPALELLKEIKAPLYGIPGNHDFWARVDFGLARRVFAAQGGRWLMDESIELPGSGVKLFGVTGGKQPNWELSKSGANILLSHYPNWSEKISGARFDLILSGHSHGGQVRLPGVGALLTPSGVGRFELGMFETAAGPMYVNPGIGYFYANIRFCCRPEVTVFEV
jgi:hypothetical protein